MAIDTLGANALASDSVTTAKIVNDAVTSAKIPDGAVVAADVADGSISTAKLADDAVTSAKLDTNISIGGTLGVTGKITSTAGVTFGSDTASANVLDDYEEGTFTPSVTFTGGAPSAGATTGFGTYQKIGNIVYAHLKASNINVTGASGDIQIENMPFTARLDTDMDAFEGTAAVSSMSTIGYNTSSILDNTSNCRIMESGNTTSEIRDVITTSNCSHGASDFFIFVAYPVS